MRNSGIAKLIVIVTFRKAPGRLGRWYRTGLLFSNGRQPAWDYPREAPGGDQVDLVEVMDIEEGVIVRHRVYWGWVGFRSLLAAVAESRPRP